MAKNSTFGLSLLAKLAPRVVPVPEYGAFVAVRNLAHCEPFADMSTQDRVNRIATIVIVCACDEAGNPIFDESDRAALLASDGMAMTAIAEAAMRANRLDADDSKT